jgi:hypothetical protein
MVRSSNEFIIRLQRIILLQATFSITRTTRSPSAELMRGPEIQPQQTRRPPIDTAVLPPFNSLAFPRKRISRFQATVLLNNRMATTSRRRLTETVGLPRTVRTLSIGSDSSTLSPAFIQVMVTALRPPATPSMPSNRRSRDNNQRSSQTCNRIRTFKINWPRYSKPLDRLQPTFHRTASRSSVRPRRDSSGIFKARIFQPITRTATIIRSSDRLGRAIESRILHGSQVLDSARHSQTAATTTRLRPIKIASTTASAA